MNELKPIWVLCLSAFEFYGDQVVISLIYRESIAIGQAI